MKTLAILCILLTTTTVAWAGVHDCPTQGQFKGVELYSWHTADGAWVFGMLPGTNRAKTETEIKTQNKCLLTPEGLERAFLRLGTADEVFWQRNEDLGFAYPPAQIVGQVVRSAKQAGVRLHILGAPEPKG